MYYWPYINCLSITFINTMLELGPQLRCTGVTNVTLRMDNLSTRITHVIYCMYETFLCQIISSMSISIYY